MRTYSSLIISSNVDRQLNATVQRVLGLASTDVVDTQSPEVARRRERLGKVMGATLTTSARYFWRLTSKDAVDSQDIGDHIEWLLNQLGPDCAIYDMHRYEAVAFIVCFWEGNGRGVGPTLSPALMRQLSQHGVELRIEFYVESDVEN